MQLGPSIRLGEKYLDLFQPADHKAYYGGRGSAKSHSFGTVLAINSCERYERVICARQFQNSIQDSVKELIEQKIHNELNMSYMFKITDKEIEHVGNGSRYSFIGLDRNPSSVKSFEGATKAWVEEAQTIKAKSMEMLIPTIRANGSECWWSWNPGQPEDPVDAYFRGDVVPYNSIIREVGIEDNPWFFGTRMPQEMELLRRKDEERYEHVWLGGYDILSAARIFKNTQAGRIDLPQGLQPDFGMDFGFAQDPNALVKVYVLQEERVIYIAGAMYGHNTPLEDLPAYIRALSGADEALITADSARPETIDFLNGKGFAVEGAIKGPGSVKAGIEFLQGYDIYIDPLCTDMLDEARLYSWTVNKQTGKITRVPVDANNHFWDAIRYATEKYWQPSVTVS